MELIKKLIRRLLGAFLTLLLLWQFFILVKVFAKNDLPLIDTTIQAVRYPICAIANPSEVCQKYFPYGHKFYSLYGQELVKEAREFKNFLVNLWEK
jgi:hypothetical protein